MEKNKPVFFQTTVFDYRVGILGLIGIMQEDLKPHIFRVCRLLL